MAENMTDEEQLQILKNWWKENGRSLVLIVSLALIAYFGWGWWNTHQQRQGEAASAIYSELMETAASNLQEALSDEKRSTAEFLIKQLQDEYGTSLYAVSASLLGAKLAVEQGDLPLAEKQLAIALKNADSDTKMIASLRLARVYLVQEKYADALALVEDVNDDSFAGLSAELKGDILTAKGELQQAQAAYQLALEKLSADSGQQKRFIEIKLSNLLAEGQ